MAKKKPKTEETAEPATEFNIDEVLARLTKEFERDYGAGVFISGDEELSKKRMVIPFSPALDAISGGIEEGSFVGLTGNPKQGKSVSALSFAATCQRPEYGNRFVVYAKIEGKFSTEHARGIKGLDMGPSKFRLINSAEGNILPAHSTLNMLSDCIKTIPGCCVIIDSVSNLCDASELNATLGESSQIAAGTRLVSQFVRQMSQVVPVNRTIIICITQMISNIQTQHLMEKSARALQYRYDYMFRVIGNEAWKSGERIIGIKIKWLSKTSPLGLPPGLTTESYFRFGTGIDKLYEAIIIGIDAGFLTQSGSWFNLDFLQQSIGKTPKYQGGERVYQALLDNPDWASCLESKIRDISGKRVIGGSNDE